jgi:hypothetical protein
MKASLVSSLLAMFLTGMTGYVAELKNHTGLTVMLFLVALVAWIVAVGSIVWAVLVYQENKIDKEHKTIYWNYEEGFVDEEKKD